jgi:hypothetical protein
VREKKFSQKMKVLLSNGPFICLCMSLSGLYFIITGVQFWVSDYFKIVLQMPPEQVFGFFIVTCLTAPILGVLLGGSVTQYIGGYHTP